MIATFVCGVLKAISDITNAVKSILDSLYMTLTTP